MSFEDLKQKIPSFGKDIKLSLSTILSQPSLTPLQTWGCVLACATSLGDKELVDATITEAGEALSAEQREEVQGVASVMIMNNVYYRFCHLAEDSELLSLPAGLRMNALRTKAISDIDRELIALAVSALNGCGLCIESHYKKLREEGVGRDVLTGVAKIAAVVNGLSKLAILG
jgi:lipoyl-dependent peroxiredoxin subunit D